MSFEAQHKGISRIDSRSTHGWFVRAYSQSKTFSRLFSDKRYGGRAPAWQAAVAYHGQLVAELAELPRRPRPRRLVLRDSRNTSGVLGVCRTVKRGSNGALNPCYSVSWRPTPGVQKCTSFSIRKYGESRAFRLAVRHRLKMLRQIYGASAVGKLRPPVPASAPENRRHSAFL